MRFVGSCFPEIAVGKKWFNLLTMSSIDFRDHAQRAGALRSKASSFCFLTHTVSFGAYCAHTSLAEKSDLVGTNSDISPF